jgi:signal transduction histidine kinase
MSMVEDGTLSPDQCARFVPLLSAKLRQIELLVRQMLETARMERGKLVLRGDVFDVGETLARVVESFRPLAAHGHELQFLVSDRPAIVTADEDRVEAVISNLVDNAIKYSPRGGSVTCMVATVADRVFVSVHDEGLGIAREDVPRLFTPFGRIVTPENAHIGGTGLGL